MNRFESNEVVNSCSKTTHLRVRRLDRRAGEERAIHYQVAEKVLRISGTKRVKFLGILQLLRIYTSFLALHSNVSYCHWFLCQEIVKRQAAACSILKLVVVLCQQVALQ